MEGHLEQSIPLPQAAARLGLTWHATYALLLKGAIKGEWRGTRWWVEDTSLEQYEREASS